MIDLDGVIILLNMMESLYDWPWWSHYIIDLDGVILLLNLMESLFDIDVVII